MARLNKRQKHILTCLNKKFPNSLSYEVLLGELGNDPEDIFCLDDLRMKGLVDISCTDFLYKNGTKSHETPKDSWITLEGRAKLQETFFSRIMLFMIGIEAVFILSIIRLF